MSFSPTRSMNTSLPFEHNSGCIHQELPFQRINISKVKPFSFYKYLLFCTMQIYPLYGYSGYEFVICSNEGDLEQHVHKELLSRSWICIQKVNVIFVILHLFTFTLHCTDWDFLASPIIRNNIYHQPKNTTWTCTFKTTPTNLIIF